MFNNAPTRFRSRYTGQEIEVLLSSIPEKIDLSLIINDFTGGTQKIASAELAKRLDGRLNKFADPNYMKDLFLSIPNTVLFTKDMLTKLNTLGTSMLGSFPDAATRNATVSTTMLGGGEITFLVKNEEGIQEMSYWDNLKLKWVRSDWVLSPIIDKKTMPSIGNAVVYRFAFDNKRVGKYIIYAESSADMYCCELTIMRKIGGDIYYSITNEIGSRFNLGTYNKSVTDLAPINIGQDGNVVVINMDMQVPNMTFSISRIAEF